MFALGLRWITDCRSCQIHACIRFDPKFGSVLVRVIFVFQCQFSLRWEFIFDSLFTPSSFTLSCLFPFFCYIFFSTAYFAGVVVFVAISVSAVNKTQTLLRRTNICKDQLLFKVLCIYFCFRFCFVLVSFCFCFCSFWFVGLFSFFSIRITIFKMKRNDPPMETNFKNSKDRLSDCSQLQSKSWKNLSKSSFWSEKCLNL